MIKDLQYLPIQQKFYLSKLYDWRIDSFKLTIDLKHLSNVNITSNLYLVDDNFVNTGEILAEFKNHSLKFDYNGSTIYYSFLKVETGAVIYEKLILLFSSKVRQEEYFKGIDKNTIIDIFEHLKYFLKVIDYESFTKDIWYNLEYRDLDLKQDYFCNSKYIELTNSLHKYNISQLKNEFIANSNQGCFFKSKNHKNNKGYQINARDTATVSRPHFKFYFKNLELNTNKNSEFLHNLLKFDYLNAFLSDNIILRYEFTIKSLKQIRAYKLPVKFYQFYNILTLDNHKFNKLFVEKYYKTNFIGLTYSKTLSELSPKDVIIKRLCEYSNISYFNAVKLATLDYSGNQKSRNKKLISDLFQLEIEHEKSNKNKLINRKDIKMMQNIDEFLKIFTNSQ